MNIACACWNWVFHKITEVLEMTTYKLCLMMLEKGKLTAEMLDVYFAAGRLTAEQYFELLAMLEA